MWVKVYSNSASQSSKGKALENWCQPYEACLDIDISLIPIQMAIFISKVDIVLFLGGCDSYHRSYNRPCVN